VFKKNKFIYLSVFFHLIVIYVVAQSVMFPSVSDAPQKKSKIIQATVIFSFPPKTQKLPVKTNEEEKPKPVKPEEDLPVVEAPADSQIEPITEPALQTIPISPQSQVPVVKREAEILEEPEQNDGINIIEKQITPTPNSDVHTTAKSMARRHLNSFQQQQQYRVAEQASRYYQQHKNSPVINAEVKNPFMTEGEKLRDTLKVRADCSSASKKTAAVLLSILGGQIDCSKPPPISSFIQNRINKSPNLPEKYQQEDQKMPQSIVIKKQP
jgi:hypothetical protein